MPRDDHTYGFSKPKAQAIDAQIGTKDVPYVEGKVRSGGDRLRVFVTPVGGIPARSGATLGSATCTLYTVTGGTRASTTTTTTVYNDFTTAVGASTDIVAAWINGIWVAIAEDC